MMTWNVLKGCRTLGQYTWLCKLGTLPSPSASALGAALRVGCTGLVFADFEDDIPRMRAFLPGTSLVSAVLEPNLLEVYWETLTRSFNLEQYMQRIPEPVFSFMRLSLLKRGEVKVLDGLMYAVRRRRR